MSARASAVIWETSIEPCKPARKIADESKTFFQFILVLSISAVGMNLILVIVWGGGKRRIHFPSFVLPPSKVGVSYPDMSLTFSASPKECLWIVRDLIAIQ